MDARTNRPMPLLDDWVDGKPDAWDYNGVLTENNVTVEWCDTLVDDDDNESPAGACCGFGPQIPRRWPRPTIGPRQPRRAGAANRRIIRMTQWPRSRSSSPSAPPTPCAAFRATDWRMSKS